MTQNHVSPGHQRAVLGVVAVVAVMGYWWLVAFLVFRDDESPLGTSAPTSTETPALPVPLVDLGWDERVVAGQMATNGGQGVLEAAPVDGVDLVEIGRWSSACTSRSPRPRRSGTSRLAPRS